ncbi:MAG: hypothetical protein ABI778_12915, partial [Ignavibacteriota bacterium]
INGGNISGLNLRLLPRFHTADNVLSLEGVYEASEQRASRIERVFFPVHAGLGNYRYLGDLNGNNKQDPEEFALAGYSDQGEYILLTLPTESLFPVTDLRTSLRIRLTPFPFFGLETALRLEEKSSTGNPADIYLLRLSHFLGDSSTIRGFQEIQQDVNLLENNTDHSYRLRFLERKNSTQYNTGLEEVYYREVSLRGRFHPSFEFSNESNLSYITDNARAEAHSTTQPHSVKRLEIRTEWTYDPFASLFGFGLKGQFSRGSDNSYSPATTLAQNSITLETRYRIGSSARIRAEIGRDELILRNTSNQLAVPYALTFGKSPGATWLWKLSADLQFASGIILTAVYDGRSELTNSIDRSIIHNMRAEIRASF